MPTRLKLARSTSNPGTKNEFKTLVRQPNHESWTRGRKFGVIATSHRLRCPAGDSVHRRTTGAPPVKQGFHFHNCMTCASGHHGPATQDFIQGRTCTKHLWICSGEWHDCKDANHPRHADSGCGFNVCTMWIIGKVHRTVLPDTGEKVHTHWDQDRGPGIVINSAIRQFTQMFWDTLEDQHKRALGKY